MDELGGYTMRQVADTLRACQASWVEWPPTLLQIREELKQTNLASRQPAPALEAPRNLDVGIAGIAECRKVLNG